ncbi:M28 family peptidase [Chitinophaga lutea]|uniref:M28 family peptidase n=1 Tax=Chitinophaga lutea TaxID=2488634 RepID=A0A3N4Q214_9BACT|nr:M28 family peptidase [Chitinophaga lutea]RPE13615.1 M28 family peptidase [Chitinophaga lutea]
MKKLLTALSCFISSSAFAQIDSAQLMKDVQTLAADKMEGRKAGSRGNRMAQFYLLDRFKQVPLQSFNNTFEQPFYFTRSDKRTMGTNLYGYVKGRVDSFVVISAHYDHVGIGKPNQEKDSIYNGADDNASGVAVLLAIAKYYAAHPPKYNLIFAAFDAEEMGLQGAKAFVARPPVPLARIVANLNMDMVSHNDKNELWVCGTSHYPQLKRYITAVAPNSRVSLPMGHDQEKDSSQNWTNQSDHYEFHKVKIPFLYFGVEDHPDYHQPSDEFSRINPTFFYNAAQALLNVVKAINE